MYQCMLRIYLCCADPLLEAAFKSAQAAPNFTHTLTFNPGALSFPAGALAKEDVLIIGPEHLGRLREIKQELKATARVILVDGSGRAASLSDEAASLLDDAWPGTGNAAFFSLRVKALLRDALLRKEHELVKQCLTTAIDTTPDLVWFKDKRGAHLKVNNAFCQFVGKSKEEVEGRGHYFIWDIEPEEYAESEFVCLETEEEVITRGEVCVFDEVVKSKDELRQFKTRKAPIFDEEGTILGTVGIAYDMTDLANRGAEINIILQSMPFAAMILDATDTIINVNEKFCHFFQIQSPDEVIGTKREVLRRRVMDTHRLKFFANHVEVRSWQGGKELIYESYEREITDIFNNRLGRLAIYRDVTLERSFSRQLENKANTDDLTGLFNRRYFYANLPESIQPGTGLLFVDLDNFKQVNDVHGHHAGDDALKVTARLLLEHFPKALIARLGGDEFVLYLPESCMLQNIVAEAERLRDAMQKAFVAELSLRKLSVSIGVVTVDAAALSRDELVRRGDVAMYEAKRLGKNLVCLYSWQLEEEQVQELDSPSSGVSRSSCCRLPPSTVEPTR